VQFRDGRVLVTGGLGNGGYLTNSELYDPLSGVWTNSGALTKARDYHTATLLSDGRVLAAGGYGSGAAGALNTAELYDAISGRWTNANPMATARRYHTATLLPNGRVLMAGGNNNVNQWLASCELYDSTNVPSAIFHLGKTFRLSGGSLQLVFASSFPSNTVLAATNPAAISNVWIPLGSAVETPPGSGWFQFNDAQATNHPKRFYRVRLP